MNCFAPRLASCERPNKIGRIQDCVIAIVFPDTVYFHKIVTSNLNYRFNSNIYLLSIPYFRKAFVLLRQTRIFLFMYYSKVDDQTVIKVSYTPCPIIKDKVEQFLIFNLHKQKKTPIPVVISIWIILPLNKWDTPKRTDEPIIAIISFWLMNLIF